MAANQTVQSNPAPPSLTPATGQAQQWSRCSWHRQLQAGHPRCGQRQGGHCRGVGRHEPDGRTNIVWAHVVVPLNPADGTPPVSHTVTFYANGGSGTMAPQTANVPTALTANAFTRAGYNFTGWNTEASGSGTAYADGAVYNFAADATLYAQWAIKTYTITATAGTGGSITPSGAVTVNHGASQTFAIAPATGYEVEEVKVDGASVGAVTSYTFTSVQANHTIAATFKALPVVTYSITLEYTGPADPVGGRDTMEVTATVKDQFGNPVAGVKLGFIFAAQPGSVGLITSPPVRGPGSTTGVDGKVTFTWTESLGEYGDVEAYAFWDKNDNGEQDEDETVVSNTITVTILRATHAVTLTASPSGAGSVTGAGTYYHGEGVVVEATANQGYEFYTWLEGETPIPEAGAEYTFTITSNRNLTAQFNTKFYTLTFDTAGGSPIEPMTLAYGAPVTAPEAPTKDGYTFDGWDPVLPATMPAEDLTVVAQWTALPSHTVTFDANGGDGAMAPQTANVPTALTANAFTYTGYTFQGWNTAADGSGTAYADEAVYDFAADVTLYAQWTALPSHTVTFDANGGDGAMAPQTANVPTALTANAFTYTGYTFQGWNTAADGSGTAYADEAVYDFAADVTLYAQWTALPSHTVTFDANGGDGAMAPQTANVPTALTANAFTYTGYTFQGWNTAADGSGTAYADEAVYDFAADVTLYAQWTANTYTITYNAGPGGSISGETSQTVEYGQDGTEVEAVPASGYRFTGWSDGVTTAKRTDTNITADLDVTAHFEKLLNPVLTFVDPEGLEGYASSDTLTVQWKSDIDLDACQFGLWARSGNEGWYLLGLVEKGAALARTVYTATVSLTDVPRDWYQVIIGYRATPASAWTGWGTSFGFVFGVDEPQRPKWRSPFPSR